MRLATVIERFEGDLLAREDLKLLPGARRALAAMKHCRQPGALQLLGACPQCHRTVRIPHACGHRSCPHCQHHTSECWRNRHGERLLPVDYFLVTFTLPAALRSTAWAHQRPLYDAMLRSAWQCLAQFARNERRLGVEIGASAVLHTHNRRRDYHPHVHLLVPAGGLDPKQKLWRRKERYLFNARNLARVFRAKLLTALHALGLPLPARLPQQWVAHCRRVGGGQKALDYLARYLYRGVLSERDILGCHDGQVSFRYTEAKSRRRRVRTLPGAEFLWLLLQHVLPKGFRRARDYGLLHPRRQSLLKRVQCLLQVKLPLSAPPERPPLLCPHCAAPMRILGTCLPCTSPRPLYSPTQAALGASM